MLLDSSACSWDSSPPIGFPHTASVKGPLPCFIESCFVLICYALLVVFSEEEIEQEWICREGMWEDLGGVKGG